MTPACSEDVYGNSYNLLMYFDFHKNNVFLICTFILLYFNLKYYISYKNITHRSTSTRRLIRLLFASILNVFHVLFYFMIKDNLISVDGCMLVRTFFIFLIVDVLYDSFAKVLNYLSNFYEVFVFFLVDWLIMAALIQVLFISTPDYYDDSELYSFNFGNYFKSLFSVFVFFTGNNSPEIMMKNYPQNSGLTFGFITLIWVNNLLVTGLIIGLSYYKMKLVMSKQIEKCFADPVKKSVFEALLPYPDAKRPFVKKLIKLHMNGNEPKFISIDELKNQGALTNHYITKASEFIFDLLRSMKSYEFFYSLLDLFIACYAVF